MSDPTPPTDDENVEPDAQEAAAEGAAAAPAPVEPEGETPAAGGKPEAPAAEISGADSGEATASPPTPAAEAAPASDEPAAADPASDLDAGATPQADAAEDDDLEDDEPAVPREKPAIPGMDLEVDIVLEGDETAEDDAAESDAGEEEEDLHAEPIAASIVLAEGARYRATGKRKTAVARVILKPGTGVYLVNGKTLDAFFPRPTLQRGIRQPLEAVGFDTRMDVDVRIHGGGVSSQAGALRHGISRALLEADPNLRGALKKRGFLTRDARVKERKKAGLKKARKKPQFSKR